jgi:hypothetical protein
MAQVCRRRDQRCACDVILREGMIEASSDPELG